MSSTTGDKSYPLYVGSYGGHLTSLSFSPSSSSKLSTKAKLTNAGSAPSWLYKKGSLIYTADEFSKTDGQHYCFEIGNDPCELKRVGEFGISNSLGSVSLISNDQGYLYSANYESGSIDAIPLDEQGHYRRIESRTEIETISFVGAGPNLERQTSPHAHQVSIEPKHNRYLFVCDLGSDSIRVFDTNDKGKLKALDQIAITPGFGPRHLIFSEMNDKVFVYLVNELSNDLVVAELEYPKDEKEHFTFDILQTISTLPKDQPTKDWLGAELVISPDRTHLFVSNRSPPETEPKNRQDLITIFKVEGNGKLMTGEENVEFLETGLHPRHMSLSNDREGKYLAVACQNSNEVIVYERDGGRLKEISKVEVEKPTCVIWG